MNEDRRRSLRYLIVSRYNNNNTCSFVLEHNRYRSQRKYENDLSDVHAENQGAEYNIRAYGVAGYVHKHSKFFPQAGIVSKRKP